MYGDGANKGLFHRYNGAIWPLRVLELCRIVGTQSALEDLPGDRLRQSIGNEDVSGNFKARQFLAAGRNQPPA